MPCLINELSAVPPPSHLSQVLSDIKLGGNGNGDGNGNGCLVFHLSFLFQPINTLFTECKALCSLLTWWLSELLCSKGSSKNDCALGVFTNHIFFVCAIRHTTYEFSLSACDKELNHKLFFIKKTLPAGMNLSFVADKIGENLTKPIYSGSYEKYCLWKHGTLTKYQHFTPICV